MAAELEEAIQARGRELLQAIEPEGLIRLSPDWWQERVLEWATADPDTRRRLLQFVDVLPALRTPAAIADHVRQYFRTDRHRTARIGAAVAGERAFRPILSRVVREGVFAMASRFIVAQTAAEALGPLRDLAREGVRYTIDVLGEATLSELEADRVRDHYLDALRALAIPEGERPPAWEMNISVKLSALTSRFEPAAPEATLAAVRPRLVRILRLARETGAFVNIDMEQYRFKDLIHRIVASVASEAEFRDWDGLGIVVQAYLRDAETDIAKLAVVAEAREAPVTVRLVKGAYWDEETAFAEQEDRRPPVFVGKEATDASFERATAALLGAYPQLRAAFGTHNPRSIAQAMARTESMAVPREHVEFQTLYGMAEGVRKATGRMGYRTRVYAPVGEIVPGMAYLVRRLLENTSNESWFVNRHESGSAAESLRPPSAVEAPLPARRGFRNATPAQFDDPAVRARMEAALERARRAFGRHHPLLAGAGTVDSEVRDEVRAPAEPSLLLGTVSRATLADVEAAVRDAASIAQEWGETTVGDRAAILRGAAELMEERRFDFAAAMVFESAKPWREADGDVCEAIDYLRYYAAQAERLAADTGVDSRSGEANSYGYEPRGVAAVIAPWNFPLAIVTGMTSAALAAGCPAIVKPAEQSPLVASAMVATLREAGIPPRALSFLPGPGEVVGQALVDHQDVDVIAFTGSNAVGLGILSAAANVRPGQRNVKKVVLEMGGKNAIIVDEDADLDEAVAGVVHSAFGYAGQKCSACSRVIVVGSAAEPFRARLAEAVASLVIGPPEAPYTFVPPVIDAESKERLNGAISEASGAGRLLARGPDVPPTGNYVVPHVFEGINPGHRLAQTELFGPVLLLFSAASFEDALEMAMDSPFALTGGVFSRHPAHMELARRRFRVGNLYINRRITGATVGRQPFGGSAMSGAGDKAGGPDYLLNFCWPRSVTENTMRHGFVPE